MEKIYDKYREKGDIHWQEYQKDPDYKAWVDWLVSLFLADKNAWILDIGCGDGLFADKLSQKEFYIYGIDSSESGIKIAQEKNKGSIFRVVGIEFLSDHRVAKFTFDYMLASEVIEHLKNPNDLVAVFDRCIHNYMILTTPNGEVNQLKNKYHYHIFTEKDIREIFSGYKVERLFNEELKGGYTPIGNLVMKISKGDAIKFLMKPLKVFI